MDPMLTVITLTIFTKERIFTLKPQQTETNSTTYKQKLISTKGRKVENGEIGYIVGHIKGAK